MTQKEKARRYDEALERAEKALEVLGTDKCEGARQIFSLFPELKESKDERIRKVIIGLLKQSTYEDCDYDGVNMKDIYAWLEKQGETYTKRDVDDAYLEGMAFAKDELEKQGEQKPVDNVGSKFKVEEGKWYVCTQTFVLRGKIVIIKGQTYQAEKDNVIKGENGCRFIDRHDGKASDYFRSWTILYAKDGDVLACENGWTCIFKCLNDNLFSSHCFMDHEGWFCEDGGQAHTLDNRICGEIYPATNEQCDTLMKAMADAGYTFDFDKKELKKSEQKSAEWSEEDEKMLNSIIEDFGDGKTSNILQEYWLKSLRPQNRWMPSDEQMEIINMLLTNEAMDDNVARVLRELKEQLKKLKGENI